MTMSANSPRPANPADRSPPKNGLLIARPGSLLRNALAGAAGGLLATIPMTAFMAAFFRRLPWYERYPLPPRQITMKLARQMGVAQRLNEPERAVATAAAHLGYGAAMGALYGLASPVARGSGPVGGVAFGLAVWAGSYLGYLPALGILRPATEHPLSRSALMIGAHVVWGGTLGSLNRLRNALKKKRQ